jgi:broad specificity phosphatase PhoE
VTRIILIRHGETKSNRETRFRGLDDVPLSERGVRQAASLASALAGSGVGALYTSPLLRARETAEPLGRALGVEPVVADAFTDLDFGEWTGRTLDEVREEWPDLWRTWVTSPERAALPGGGSLEDVRLRASSRLREVASSAGTKGVAVVSHRVVLKLVVLDALGLGPEGFFRLRVDPASVTEIVCDGGRVLARLNDCSHLRGTASFGPDF